VRRRVNAMRMWQNVDMVASAGGSCGVRNKLVGSGDHGAGIPLPETALRSTQPSRVWSSRRRSLRARFVRFLAASVLKMRTIRQGSRHLHCGEKCHSVSSRATIATHESATQLEETRRADAECGIPGFPENALTAVKPHRRQSVAREGDSRLACDTSTEAASPVGARYPVRREGND